MESSDGEDPCNSQSNEVSYMNAGNYFSYMHTLDLCIAMYIILYTIFVSSLYRILKN